MTNLPIQPRPFENKEFELKYADITGWISFPEWTADDNVFNLTLSERLSDYKQGELDYGSCSRTLLTDPSFSYIHKEAEKLNALIYRALHPPLDFAHALEIGYVFREGQKYVFGGHDSLEPIFHTSTLDEVMVFAYIDKWFYPCNKYGQPTHGEAESYVKAWEVGE